MVRNIKPNTQTGLPEVTYTALGILFLVLAILVLLVNFFIAIYGGKKFLFLIAEK